MVDMDETVPLTSHKLQKKGDEEVDTAFQSNMAGDNYEESNETSTLSDQAGSEPWTITRMVVEEIAKFRRSRNTNTSEDIRRAEKREKEKQQLETVLRALRRSRESSDNPPPKFITPVIWMAVNTLATIGIVFTNKVIFSDPVWGQFQLGFAIIHFFLTFMILHALGHPLFGFFTRRRISLKHSIPLAVAMCLNVVLPNLSLQHSSVTFYQVARILLTPVAALLNYFIDGATLPMDAIFSLIPACLGVGLVSYYDSLPASDVDVQTTSALGVVFAFSGVIASSLYTVWIASYRRKLQMNSMQLLHSYILVAIEVLTLSMPFIDRVPYWREVSENSLLMVTLSGFLACILNISQFFIIAQTDPVSSTVVGHFKTCVIVGLGWMLSGREIGDKSIIGIVMAIGGLVAYSSVMLRHIARA